MDFSQHSCPSCLWQPNHDLCLQLALWGRVSCPSRSGRILMVLVGMESWGLGLNLVPQLQEQRFFLTRSQQQWVFTCALGRHDFLFLPEWLRPFLLLMREEPGQEDASSPAFPTVAADLSCMPPNEGSSVEPQHPPLPAGLSHQYLVGILERACECMQAPLVSQAPRDLTLSCQPKFDLFNSSLRFSFISSYCSHHDQHFFLSCCATGEPVYKSDLSLEGSVPL